MRLVGIVGLVVTLLAVMVQSASASVVPATGHYHRYVALGDSYAAGPGIPIQYGTPAGCGRSSHNYPSLLAETLRVARFTDVSCGGATTANMTVPEQVSDGTNPPQFDALTPDTDLVTLTVGGNDIGFGEIVSACGALAATDPTGDPCQRHYTSGGTDELAARVAAVAPLLRNVLIGIRRRAPHATIMVVGPLRILPSTGGCYPEVPFATGDTSYLNRIQGLLSSVTEQQARITGALFVDSYRFSYGHDACEPAGQRWVEGVRPESPAAPLHPNATGMAAVAALSRLRLLIQVTEPAPRPRFGRDGGGEAAGNWPARR